MKGRWLRHKSISRTRNFFFFFSFSETLFFSWIKEFYARVIKMFPVIKFSFLYYIYLLYIYIYIILLLNFSIYDIIIIKYSLLLYIHCYYTITIIVLKFSGNTRLIKYIYDRKFILFVGITCWKAVAIFLVILQEIGIWWKSVWI